MFVTIVTRTSLNVRCKMFFILCGFLGICYIIANIALFGMICEQIIKTIPEVIRYFPKGLGYLTILVLFLFVCIFL